MGYPPKRAYVNAPLVGWECPIDGTRLVGGWHGVQSAPVEYCSKCGHPMLVRGAKPYDQAKIDAANALSRRAATRWARRHAP